MGRAKEKHGFPKDQGHWTKVAYLTCLDKDGRRESSLLIYGTPPGATATRRS
jgi:hypothetical protein